MTQLQLYLTLASKLLLAKGINISNTLIIASSFSIKVTRIVTTNGADILAVKLIIYLERWNSKWSNFRVLEIILVVLKLDFFNIIRSKESRLVSRIDYLPYWSRNVCFNNHLHTLIKIQVILSWSKWHSVIGQISSAPQSTSTKTLNPSA